MSDFHQAMPLLSSTKAQMRWHKLNRTTLLTSSEDQNVIYFFQHLRNNDQLNKIENAAMTLLRWHVVIYFYMQTGIFILL